MNYKFSINYTARPKIFVNVFDDTITSESGVTETGAIEMIQNKVLERSNDLECEFTKQHVLNVVKLLLPRFNSLPKDDSLQLTTNDIKIDWSNGEFKIIGDVDFSSDNVYRFNDDCASVWFFDTITSMLNRNDFYIDLTPITNLEYEFDFEIGIEASISDIRGRVYLDNELMILIKSKGD